MVKPLHAFAPSLRLHLGPNFSEPRRESAPASPGSRAWAFPCPRTRRNRRTPTARRRRSSAARATPTRAGILSQFSGVLPAEALAGKAAIELLVARFGSHANSAQSSRRFLNVPRAPMDCQQTLTALGYGVATKRDKARRGGLRSRLSVAASRSVRLVPWYWPPLSLWREFAIVGQWLDSGSAPAWNTVQHGEYHVLRQRLVEALMKSRRIASTCRRPNR